MTRSRYRFEVTIWRGSDVLGIASFARTLGEVYAVVEAFEADPEVKRIRAVQLRSDGRPMRYAFRAWHRDPDVGLILGWEGMPS